MSPRAPKPHVVVFGVHWPPETFVIDRLEGLVRSGMTVTVAVVLWLRREPPPPGIRLIPAMYAAEPGSRYVMRGLWSLVRIMATRPRAALRLLRAVRKPTATHRPIRGMEALDRLCAYAQLAALRPSALHIEWSSVALEHYSLMSAVRCPSVISCHSEPVLDEPERPPAPAGPAIGAVYARACAIHCVADSIRQEAVRLGADPSRTRLIYGGVDLELFRSDAGPRHSAGRLEVVMVSQLRWMKGHEYALLALARLIAGGVPVRLEIIGGEPTPEMDEPSQRSRIRFVTEQLGLSEHVHLAGGLARNEVAARMSQADVLLHTSVSEALPTVVLEAMACRLPVVATAVGGTGEAVRDGVEGVLIPPYDAGAAASALARLWRDPDLRRRMGQAGRARAEELFGLERHLEQWVELYGAVASR